MLILKVDVCPTKKEKVEATVMGCDSEQTDPRQLPERAECIKKTYVIKTGCMVPNGSAYDRFVSTLNTGP